MNGEGTTSKVDCQTFKWSPIMLITASRSFLCHAWCTRSNYVVLRHRKRLPQAIHSGFIHVPIILWSTGRITFLSVRRVSATAPVLLLRCVLDRQRLINIPIHTILRRPQIWPRLLLLQLGRMRVQVVRTIRIGDVMYRLRVRPRLRHIHTGLNFGLFGQVGYFSDPSYQASSPSWWVNTFEKGPGV